MTVTAGTAYVDIAPRLDHFGGALTKGLAGAFSKLGNFPALDKFSKKLQGLSSGVSGKLTAGVTVPLIAIGGAAIASALDVEKAEFTIRRRTGETGTALRGLNDVFKSVASQTSASFGDVATTISDIHQRLGLIGKPLADLTTTMLQLNKVTEGSGPNVETVTKLFALWGVQTKDQVGTLDKLYRASQKSGEGVGELASNLQTFGPQLQAVGFNLDEATALLGTLGKAGLNTGQVMGGLRKFFAGFAKGSKDLSKATTANAKATDAVAKARQKLAEIEAKQHTKAKLTLSDHFALQHAQENLHAALAHSSATFKDLAAAQKAASEGGKSAKTVFFDVVSRIQALAKAGQKTAALKLGISIFGSRGVGLVQAAISGKIAYGDFLKVMEKGHGTIKDAAKKTQTFGDRLKVFKNQAQIALAPLGEKLFPLITSTLKTLLPLLTGLLGFLAKIPAPIIVLVPLVLAMSTVWSKLSTAVGLLKVQLGELWTTMLANPFIALAVIIVGTIVLLITHWQDFKRGLSRIWGFIKQEAGVVWHAIEAIIVNPVKRVIGWITGAFKAVAGWLGRTWRGIGHAIGDVWSGIKTGIKDSINFIIDAINGLIQAILLPLRILTHIPFVPFKGQIQEAVNAAKIPHLDEGGVVQKTGLAVVHKGERWSGVVGGKAREMGGDTYNINIYPQNMVSTKRELIDEIYAALLKRKRSNSTLGLA